MSGAVLLLKPAKTKGKSFNDFAPVFFLRLKCGYVFGRTDFNVFLFKVLSD